MSLTRIYLAAVLSLPRMVQADAPAPAVISIDAASSPGPVNRLVFGHNVESAETARIFHSDTNDLVSLRSGNGLWDPEANAPIPVMAEHARTVGMAMLRYPGGSLSCNFDFRKAVGPIETRGDWKFGVDEYLSFCQTVGAAPMFTVSDYVLPADQMPAHAASLVEYLNAPATPEHPWAMKRQEWGHPKPYGVQWFELGNESASGNMRVLPHRVYNAEQYAAYANATAAAMRAVDPTIKIGIVTHEGPGTDAECAWNRTVVHLAGKSADFLIVHLYGPSVAKSTPQPDFWQACMAAGDQSARHLDDYQAMALRESGRALPVAVTEYNGPCPDRAETRFSYGVALECADLLRVYLQPEHHVLTANYWQFVNGAFGMVRSDREDPTGGKIVEEPAFTLFSLWTAHLGTKLATVKVAGPGVAFPGAGSVYPSAGDTFVPPQPLGDVPTDGVIKSGSIGGGVTVSSGTGANFVVRFDDVKEPSYPKLAVIDRPAGTGSFINNVTYEARYVPAPGTAAVPISISLGDARGWGSTRSSAVIDGVGTDWKAFQGEYRSLPDTAGVELQVRLLGGGSKISGQLEVRGLKIAASTAPQFPAYALLTASSSLSEDGKTLHLIVFNKSAEQDIPAQLHVAGFQAASASFSEVNGPSFDAVTGVTSSQGTPLDLTGTGPSHVFPAHSMTAIDFVAQ